MWSILHITSLFAYATALSSLPKRSVPDESTPAREFEGMCVEYVRNNFKIVNRILKWGCQQWNTRHRQWSRTSQIFTARFQFLTKSTRSIRSSRMQFLDCKWNEHFFFIELHNSFLKRVNRNICSNGIFRFWYFHKSLPISSILFFLVSFIIQKLTWRSEYTCEYAETDEISLKLRSNPLQNSAL